MRQGLSPFTSVPAVLYFANIESDVHLKNNLPCFFHAQHMPDPLDTWDCDCLDLFASLELNFYCGEHHWAPIRVIMNYFVMCFLFQIWYFQLKSYYRHYLRGMNLMVRISGFMLGGGDALALAVFRCIALPIP